MNKQQPKKQLLQAENNTFKPILVASAYYDTAFDLTGHKIKTSRKVDELTEVDKLIIETFKG
jgi:hypothetical protein